MTVARWGWLCALAVSVGCGDDGASGVGMDPDLADVAVVDRFSEGAGMLFRRSDNAQLPAAGAAIDFDVAPMFTIGIGPDGGEIQYYNFDVQTRQPMVALELWTAKGLVADQLPIIDALPGEAGYSDFWRISRVTVPDDYVANSIVDTGGIRDAGFAIQETDMILNRPVVPPGSSAAERTDDGDPGLSRAWVRGRVASYFRFEEVVLAPVPSGLFEGLVPLSYIFVTFNINPADAGGGPASGFKTEAGTDKTHNVLETLPGQERYSPLWMVNVYDNAAFDSVIDIDTVHMAQVVATPPGEVNCPLKRVTP